MSYCKRNDISNALQL